MIKINSQNSAITAIRGRSIIIGSVDANGNVSFSANPAIQFNPTEARRELVRLSRENPGKLFIAAQLVGGEFVQPTPQNISI